jgi:hypothetical protein
MFFQLPSGSESEMHQKSAAVNICKFLDRGSVEKSVRYRFFHPPRCPGAPPLDLGNGPNSGPDIRELVGWMILLPLPGADAAPPRFPLPLERGGRAFGIDSVMLRGW